MAAVPRRGTGARRVRALLRRRAARQLLNDAVLDHAVLVFPEYRQLLEEGHREDEELDVLPLEAVDEVSGDVAALHLALDGRVGGEVQEHEEGDVAAVVWEGGSDRVRRAQAQALHLADRREAAPERLDGVRRRGGGKKK